MSTDGRTDMKKLTVFFHNFTEAPNIHPFCLLTESQFTKNKMTPLVTEIGCRRWLLRTLRVSEASILPRQLNGIKINGYWDASLRTWLIKRIYFLSQTDTWKKKLESYRNWFLEQENVKVDESKRPDKSFNMSDLFGFEGTFRQLNVD